MPQSLHIWITGAGRGIGAAIAKHLGGRHRITLSGRTESTLQQVAEQLPSQNAFTAPCDVTDPQSVSAAHASAVGHFGTVDVLINNAGIGVFKDLAEMSLEEFDAQIAVNLRGVFLCAKAVLPQMIERERGMIVTINSVAAISAFSGCSGYGASKAGALALTRSLRQEVRDSHVKVTDILVGATETEIWAQEDRDTNGARMMQAQDVADAVQMLVASYDNPRTHFEEILIRPQRGDL
ncbi:MAG: SDR family NAD(P)-dependent oxidoreductase [Candidatus Kapabacteria bacterium]|nr:SDR family NAD(P)-dependent oxidoreductase [Candidatus Kapabacteria bacterium]